MAIIELCICMWVNVLSMSWFFKTIMTIERPGQMHKKLSNRLLWYYKLKKNVIRAIVKEGKDAK